jgi:hypothetical protein
MSGISALAGRPATKEMLVDLAGSNVIISNAA